MLAVGSTYWLLLSLAVPAVHVRGSQAADSLAEPSAPSTVDVGAPFGNAYVDRLVLAQSSCPLAWEPTFGHAAGVFGYVNAMTVFDDGSGPALYVGGAIYGAGNSSARHVAKWDGTQWSAVGTLSNDDFFYVYALAVYDDGSGPALYAAGDFDDDLGGTAPRVLKWNGTSWSGISGVSSNLDDAVYALAVYDDGSGPELYAGGMFFDAAYNFTHGIQKWNGTSWSMVGTGVNSSVHALRVFDDGSGPVLVASGWFSSAGGSPANRIAKWDGTSWSAFGSGMSGTNAIVLALEEFDDGSGPALYAGGTFPNASGSAVNHIARWSGASWTALGAGVSSTVRSLAAFDDGSGPALYVGGNFTSASGAPASRIAKWDGAAWTEIGGGVSGSVGALAVFDDGGGAVLSAGGEFGLAGGAGVNAVSNWDGSSWKPLGDGLNAKVEACAVFDDGSGPALYAGGRFTVDVGGAFTSGVARWNGAGWDALGGGLEAYDVNALAVFDDGGGPALYAGGYISSAGGVAVTNIAKWDGTSWSALGSGTFGPVHCFAVFDDGAGPALFVGGYFESAGGVGAKGVAKWNGATWSPLGGGTLGHVYALCVFDDGSGPALYAGGDTWFSGPGFPSRIAKWTGATWVAVGGGASLDVHAMTVFDDGGGAAMYVGGAFTMVGSTPASHIAKWNGTSWSALGTGTNGTTVDALLVFDDGNGQALYAGGAFTLAGGVAANRIAKWQGGIWSPLGSGMNGPVLALGAFDDGGGSKLYAGGSFTNAFDSGDGFLARWGCWADTTAPELSCPGSVIVADEPLGPPGTIVTFSVTAQDDYDLDPDVVSVPPSGSVFPRGATLVTCTATDTAGNRSACQFTVTVVPKVRAGVESK